MKSCYLFLASFHLLGKDESRLQYAATFAKRGALKAMGAIGAEICAPYCLPLVVTSASDTEAEWAYVLLTEFLECLKLEAVMKLVVPSVERILQACYRLCFRMTFYPFQPILLCFSFQVILF